MRDVCDVCDVCGARRSRDWSERDALFWPADASSILIKPSLRKLPVYSRPQPQLAMFVTDPYAVRVKSYWVYPVGRGITHLSTGKLGLTLLSKRSVGRCLHTV